MPVLSELESARDTGAAVRLHTVDGEVVIAQVISLHPDELVYAPITSSRPERYAVCDSTGFSLALDDIQRAELVKGQPRTRRVLPST